MATMMTIDPKTKPDTLLITLTARSESFAKRSHASKRAIVSRLLRQADALARHRVAFEVKLS
jgi:hypothetical protein